MTHTPGPWHLQRWEKGHAPQVLEASGYPIASLSQSCPQTDANARLIAAAPDLLVELQAVTLELRQWVATAESDDAALPIGLAVVERADALIARLEGHT